MQKVEEGGRREMAKEGEGGEDGGSGVRDNKQGEKES